MTPKERAVMQQALECLEDVFGKGKVDVGAITALREALEQSDEIDWIKTNKSLAKEIIELKKQAEQEPDYFGLTHDHTWLSIDKKQYDKLKPEGRMACYAAPVRTKDLTDDEIREIEFNTEPFALEFARAVIAADREKNK